MWGLHATLSELTGSRDGGEFEKFEDVGSLPFHYWLDIMNPTANQIRELEIAFGIHPLTSEDILAKDGREKLEEYAGYVFLVFAERQTTANSYREVNLNLLVFPGVIISVHHVPLKSFTQVMYHIRHSGLPASLPVDWVAYKYLDMITDEYVLMVDAIYREADLIEALITDILPGKEQVLRRIGNSFSVSHYAFIIDLSYSV